MTEAIIQKQTIILMAGLPGSGKTTLANMLKHELRCQLIDKDSIKADFMYKGLSDEYAAWYAYNESFRKVAIALQTEKRSIILDSSFLPLFVRERAIELTNSYDINLKILYCVVDNNDAIRKKRLFQRDALISQQNEKTLTMGNDPDQLAHLWPMTIQKIDTNMSPQKCLATALNLCKTYDKAYSIYSPASSFQIQRFNTTSPSSDRLTPSLDLSKSRQPKLLRSTEGAQDSFELLAA